MSADCLSFGKNKKTHKYEICDDDGFYVFKNKKQAIDKLVELLGSVIDKNPKIKKIKYENLEMFYMNYSTGYIKYKYFKDKLFQEIMERYKGAWEALAKL